MPPDLRPTLQRALETIHLQQAAELESFDGDAAVFDETRPVLQAASRGPVSRAFHTPIARALWWLAMAVVLVAFTAWGTVSWRQARRFAVYSVSPIPEPGVVVVSARREGGRSVLRGLRDRSRWYPASLLGQAGLVRATFRPPVQL